MSKCECRNCLYLRLSVGSIENKNANYYCIHPNVEYIRNYWKEHKIKKMEGHLYYGADFEKKTTPKWCPKGKKNEAQILYRVG